MGAAVLATFLIGFGLGALYAWRLMRHLVTIEIGIGLYAAFPVRLFCGQQVRRGA